MGAQATPHFGTSKTSVFSTNPQLFPQRGVIDFPSKQIIIFFTRVASLTCDPLKSMVGWNLKRNKDTATAKWCSLLQGYIASCEKSNRIKLSQWPYLTTHQIVEVTLTAESKMQLLPEAKIPFTYEVVWTKSVDKVGRQVRGQIRQVPRPKLFPT